MLQKNMSESELAPKVAKSNLLPKMREACLVALFALLGSDQEDTFLLNTLMQELKLSRSKSKEALAKAKLMMESAPDLVKELSSLCKEHRWSRIGKLEQAVLILGAYELRFEKQLPEKVVLAESARLSKKFSGLESAKFVNAMLDAFRKGASTSEATSWFGVKVDELAQEVSEGATLVFESSTKDKEVSRAP